MNVSSRLMVRSPLPSTLSLLTPITGSFAEAECLECKQQYTKEEIKPQIELGQVVYCDEKGCEGNKAALVRHSFALVR